MSIARGENRLLAALPGATREPLRKDMELVALPLRHVLFDVNVPIEHVLAAMRKRGNLA